MFFIISINCLRKDPMTNLILYILIKIKFILCTEKIFSWNEIKDPVFVLPDSNQICLLDFLVLFVGFFNSKKKKFVFFSFETSMQLHCPNVTFWSDIMLR